MLVSFACTLGELMSKVPILSKWGLHFISFHYLYIASWIVFASLVIFLGGNLRWIDALFLACNAATQGGLNTVDLNLLYRNQQITLWCVTIFTNTIFIHSCLVLVRLYWFEKRFYHVVQEAKATRRLRARRGTITVHDHSNAALIRTSSYPNARADSENHEFEEEAHNDHFDDGDSPTSRQMSLKRPSLELLMPLLLHKRQRKRQLLVSNPGSTDQERQFKERNEEHNSSKNTEAPRAQQDLPRREPANLRPQTASTSQHISIDDPGILESQVDRLPLLGSNTRFTASSDQRDNIKPQLWWNPWGWVVNIWRKRGHPQDLDPTYFPRWNTNVSSDVFDLNEERREELGGIEYRALKTLFVILVGYFLVLPVFGMLSLTPWIYSSLKYRSILHHARINEVWWSIFTTTSGFHNLGFTLTPNSMESFQGTPFPVLIMTFLIIAGNTGFPCMLRFIIWTLSKIASQNGPLREELQFLLNHPRRCFTLLFPSSTTWLLLGILIMLNGIDLIFFILLQAGDRRPAQLSSWMWVLDGLFQVAATRTAGFSILSFSQLHPALRVSSLVMMYISVFPTAISMRRTNIYEEKSLGIYLNDSASDPSDDEELKSGSSSLTGTHVRHQLGSDVWCIFFGVFLIALIEGFRLQDKHDISFNMFAVMFETVSAYSTVGLSLGYPGTNTSFSAQLKTASKIVVIAMQIRGRHRGLPYKIDRAVLLPSDTLSREDLVQESRAMLRRHRSSTLSRMSIDSRRRRNSNLLWSESSLLQTTTSE